MNVHINQEYQEDTNVLLSDDSFEDEGALEQSTPEVTKTVTTNSESNFQRKITVSQTQL